jgi:hypothetical protein
VQAVSYGLHSYWLNAGAVNAKHSAMAMIVAFISVYSALGSPCGPLFVI